MSTGYSNHHKDAGFAPPTTTTAPHGLSREAGVNQGAAAERRANDPADLTEDERAALAQTEKLGSVVEQRVDEAREPEPQA